MFTSLRRILADMGLGRPDYEELVLRRRVILHDALLELASAQAGSDRIADCGYCLRENTLVLVDYPDGTLGLCAACLNYQSFPARDAS